MNRTIHYTIEEIHHNLTILQFLKSKNYTDKAIISLKKRENGILKNNKWSYVNERLSTNDILTIHIIEDEVSKHILPIYFPLDVVYEDEDIIILNKPSDMPIHPSQNNYDNTLANALAYYFKSQDKSFVFRCVNRLDRNTTGLTLLAKHQLAGGILSNMVAKREIKRTYLAICSDDGSLPFSGTIDMPISRLDGSTIERVVDAENGETAITHFTKEKFLAHKNLSLIKLNLETGRTHQIRVHMKYINHPLIGDGLYNPEFTHINRQALHSYSLEFIHPITLAPMYFTCDLPSDMKNCLDFS